MVDAKSLKYSPDRRCLRTNFGITKECVVLGEPHRRVSEMDGEVQGRKQRREDFVKNQAVMAREIKEHE
jgi:hypothetical protein